MPWLERAPLLVISLLLLVGLILAEQAGYVARRLILRKGAGEPSSEGVGYVLSGALALLGLLVAFAFGAASDRYDTRRHLVVEEANAIGTTYRRIQALDETPKATLSQLMVQYVKARQRFFQAGDDRRRLEQSEADTTDLQNRIWAVTIAAVRANPTATINPSLLQTTNDMFDLAASRRAAEDARLPISVLRALVINALIAAAIMGCGLAPGSRQLAISAGLYLALSLAISLILDLDRPRSGTITVSQAPMDRERASLERLEEAKVVVAKPSIVP